MVSKFALRNILKDKRFLLWDDFRPVEYAGKLDPYPFWLGRFLEGFSSKKDASEEVAPREVSLAKGWGPTRAQGVRPN